VNKKCTHKMTTIINIIGQQHKGIYNVVCAG